MRILVTGGSGFIGQAVRRVAGDQYDILGFDHPDDVRDAEAVDTAVSYVDGVIHLAGILGTEETLDAEATSINVNILGAITVADACQRRGVPMVQIGTGHRGQPNVYAITKACAEDLILARARWSGLRANVVRAYHAYGPGQKPPPPYGTATVRKIIPSFVCAALTGDRLRVHGDGQQLIDLVHVDDVASVLLAALGPPYGTVLEAGTGYATTVLQAAYDVIRECGSDSTIELVPMRRGEPERTRVVAEHPFGTPASWRQPGWLDDTIGYYRGIVG